MNLTVCIFGIFHTYKKLLPRYYEAIELRGPDAGGAPVPTIFCRQHIVYKISTNFGSLYSSQLLGRNMTILDVWKQ